MSTEKMSLKGIKNVLSRAEMKKIMAGSSGGGGGTGGGGNGCVDLGQACGSMEGSGVGCCPGHTCQGGQCG